MPAESISPWLLDVASDLVKAAKAADRMGVFTFQWAGKELVRVERSQQHGMLVTFPEEERRV